MALARPGHRVNTVRGKYPSLMAPYVQHAGAMVVPNRIKQEQSTVQEGGRAEAAVLGGRIGKGGDLKGAQRLWDHP